MESVLKHALKIARASSKIRGGEIQFHRASPVVDHYRTPRSIDPFTVSVEAKIAFSKADGISEEWEKDFEASWVL
jgi:hypothetical protein